MVLAGVCVTFGQLRHLGQTVRNFLSVPPHSLSQPIRWKRPAARPGLFEASSFPARRLRPPLSHCSCHRREKPDSCSTAINFMLHGFYLCLRYRFYFLPPIVSPRLGVPLPPPPCSLALFTRSLARWSGVISPPSLLLPSPASSPRPFSGALLEGS